MPPVEHRFKPGQSGNPAGRAPGVKTFKTIITEMLDIVRKGEIDPLRADEGVTKDMTVRELVVANWIVKALEGDWKAADKLLEHLEGKPDQAVRSENKNVNVNADVADLADVDDEKLKAAHALLFGAD